MNLREYFDTVNGVGILSTANSEGKVDSAIYARPHFSDDEDDQTISFIMASHLSHANVETNPHAAYLWIEDAAGYKGRRLELTKVAEETDPEKINQVRRRSARDFCKDGSQEFLVTFRVESVRPLVGDEFK